MNQLCDLVKWILIWSLNAGFIHFIGACIILSYLTRVFRFVNVDIKTKKKEDYSDKESDKEEAS